MLAGLRSLFEGQRPPPPPPPFHKQRIPAVSLIEGRLVYQAGFVVAQAPIDLERCARILRGDASLGNSTIKPAAMVRFTET